MGIGNSVWLLLLAPPCCWCSVAMSTHSGHRMGQPNCASWSHRKMKEDEELLQRCMQRHARLAMRAPQRGGLKLQLHADVLHALSPRNVAPMRRHSVCSSSLAASLPSSRSMIKLPQALKRTSCPGLGPGSVKFSR